MGWGDALMQQSITHRMTGGWHTSSFTSSFANDEECSRRNLRRRFTRMMRSGVDTRGRLYLQKKESFHFWSSCNSCSICIQQEQDLYALSSINTSFIERRHNHACFKWSYNALARIRKPSRCVIEVSLLVSRSSVGVHDLWYERSKGAHWNLL